MMVGAGRALRQVTEVTLVWGFLPELFHNLSAQGVMLRSRSRRRTSETTPLLKGDLLPG